MNAGDPCRLCEQPLKEYMGRGGPTGAVGCEHCDRGCLRGVSNCRKCARLASTTPPKKG